MTMSCKTEPQPRRVTIKWSARIWLHRPDTTDVRVQSVLQMISFGEEIIFAKQSPLPRPRRPFERGRVAVPGQEVEVARLCSLLP